MLSSDEGDNEIFFDSADFLAPQESVLAKEELGSKKFGYEIWVNEPQSVKERRERFLQGMGLADISLKVCSQEKMMSFDASSSTLGQERIRDCGGAVSDSCNSPTDQVPEKLVLSRWKAASEANVLCDELKGCREYKADVSFQGMVCELSSSGQEHRQRESEAQEEYGHFDMGKKKMKKWWKRFVKQRKGLGGKLISKLNSETNKTRRINVKQNRKKWMEISALYIGQEIRAHKGLIWTMKFSPNGKYLASGGEDGVVRIWRVISLDTSIISFTAEDSTLISKVKWKKHSNQSFIVLPNKVFQIEESPLQEFYGHSSDVLDLAWSDSDILLSSSMDRTVRLWQIGCKQCLSVFRHNDYVTCIQFNPVDKKYFISGSIDGKVRIWRIRDDRVVDWADIRDVITAISYQPDGKGFVVGSITGTCRFYVASGKHFQLEAETRLHGKKKTTGNKITGIQFSKEKRQRVMITSEDSKVRVLDGIELVQKFRGLPKSGSQMSGSFTSSGKHIVSVGDDSHVYIWNFNDLENPSSRQIKSERSCEYFFTEGVTVAVPWSGINTEQRGSGSNFAHCSSEMQHHLEASSGVRDSERFSLGNWFSMDGSCRGSMTWPEEKLPSWDLPFAEDEYDPQQHHYQEQLLCHKDACHDRVLSETWGLSIVAAAFDGTIKTFHNFGLPIRL